MHQVHYYKTLAHSVSAVRMVDLSFLYLPFQQLTVLLVHLQTLALCVLCSCLKQSGKGNVIE